MIVAVGRLYPQKDYQCLIRAFALLRTRVPARLVILGEGPERPVLEQLVLKLGLGEEVLLPGFDPNPWRWMSKARLFILSSRWEGQPNVVNEARALGLPVVMTEYDESARDTGGEDAILVPVGDTGALSRAMEQGLAAFRSTAGKVPSRDVSNDYLSLMIGGADYNAGG